MPATYPLGNRADPTANHRTEANRRLVKSCLRLFFISPDALADQMNDRRGGAKVGLPLNGRLVTRLEIAPAAERLAVAHGDWYATIHVVYAQNYEPADAAALLGIAESTVYDRIRNGLNRLIDELWTDAPERQRA